MNGTRTGQMRHLVTWLAPPSTRDGAGQVEDYDDDQYTTFATRYAAIRAVKSTERLNEQPQGQTTYIVSQRYVAGLTLDHRMMFRGKKFEVVGLVNVDLSDVSQEVTIVDAGSGAT